LSTGSDFSVPDDEGTVSRRDGGKSPTDGHGIGQKKQSRQDGGDTNTHPQRHDERFDLTLLTILLPPGKQPPS
jgi:hypothetical protein